MRCFQSVLIKNHALSWDCVGVSLVQNMGLDGRWTTYGIVVGCLVVEFGVLCVEVYSLVDWLVIVFGRDGKHGISLSFSHTCTSTRLRQVYCVLQLSVLLFSLCFSSLCLSVSQVYWGLLGGLMLLCDIRLFLTAPVCVCSSLYLRELVLGNYQQVDCLSCAAFHSVIRNKPVPHTDCCPSPPISLIMTLTYSVCLI